MTIRINRRRLCAAIAGMSLAAPSLSAQPAFPSRPLRIVVAYSGGTGGDVVTRIVADAMSTILDQPIIVENRPGAGGMIGTEYVARAQADGYTLALATAGTLIVTPAMNSNVRYIADKDFAPVGGIARSAFVIVTAATPEAPPTFQALLAQIREKGGTFGSPGAGTTTHLAGETVLRHAGVKATHVPYRGSSQSLTDVASGQVLFGFDTVGATLPLVKGGKLRALAVTSGERVASLQDVPTISEAGLTGLEVVGWWGLAAPAATPAPIVKILSDATLRALESPQVKAKLASLEVAPFPLASAAFGNLIRKETPMLIELVKENNLAAK